MRNMYMPTESVLSWAADKPFLELFLRLEEKNSKCNLSLFVPADIILADIPKQGLCEEANNFHFPTLLAPQQVAETQHCLPRDNQSLWCRGNYTSIKTGFCSK